MPIPVSEYRNLKGIRQHLELESQFQDQVIHLAKLYGWGWPNPDDPKKYEGIYHNPDSRKDNAGLPDLILIHRAYPRMLVIELKIKGDGLSEPQVRVWARLAPIGVELDRPYVRAAGGDPYARNPHVSFHIWTPADLESGEVVRVLREAAGSNRSTDCEVNDGKLRDG